MADTSTSNAQHRNSEPFMNLKISGIAAAMSVVVVAAVAGPAMATGLAVKVSVGGSSATGSHNITGASTGGTSFQVPTLSMTCTSINLPSSPASTVSSGSAVTDVMAINKVNFVGCTGPGGALAVTTVGTFTMHVDGGATPGSSDVVQRHLENIKVNVGNAACKFTVSGRADGTFNEATQRLKINQTGFAPDRLKVSNVQGCLGQIVNGQNANWTSEVIVTSPDGPITIG